MATPTLRLYDAFPGKREAQATQKDLKEQGVQYVRIRQGNYGDGGRLKYGVFVGGKNSRMYA